MFTSSPEDDTIVSKHVGVWIICEIVLYLLVIVQNKKKLSILLVSWLTFGVRLHYAEPSVTGIALWGVTVGLELSIIHIWRYIV